MSDRENGDTPFDLENHVETLDSLDESTRRALLKKLVRVGAAAVPISMVLLDPDKARANTGSTTGGVIGG